MALTKARAAAAAIAAVALCIAIWRLGIGDPLTDAIEDRLYDLRLRLREPLSAPASVALVAIDEPSLAAIGTGAPLRLAVADAVDILREEGAAAIGIDLLLVDPTSADATLAAALARMPGAVLAIASLRDTEATRSSTAMNNALAQAAFRTVLHRRQQTMTIRPVALPQEILATAALMGHVNLLRAPDRIMRRIPLALEIGNGFTIPALPLTVARLALGLQAEALRYEAGERIMLGDRVIETDRRGSVAIVHRGPAGVFDRVSLGALLRGDLPAGGVAGRVVLIGATAESLGDIGATPLDADVPGVETLAAVTAQLIEGRAIGRGRVGVFATLTLTLAGALLAWIAALRPATPVALVATAAVWAGVLLAIAQAFVSNGLIIDATAALGATVVATAAGWSVGRLRDRREMARLEPHVTPLLERLHGDQASGSMAVVFADMVGSTSLASGRDAADTARTIAALHARIASVTEQNGGLVAEVLGDGALLVFGPDSDAAKAARAAVTAAKTLSGGVPALRVTGHFGPVALAEIGTARRRHITLAGNTVNVAARLQDEARQRGTNLLVSAALVTAAGVERGLSPTEPAHLRGVGEAIAVFSVSREAPENGNSAR